ncbi:MAG: hypothetical protein HN368_08330, partial [Spirochaetales bacterium]|nr:hypothetical protein [Spirochaetales bacterium]
MIKRKAIQIVILVSASILLSSCDQLSALLGGSSAKFNGPTPNGLVVDVYDSPIEGALVTLEETGVTTTTDSTGYWEFNLDPAFGTITLFAAKEDYQFFVPDGVPEGSFDNQYDASLAEIWLRLRLINDYIINSFTIDNAAYQGETVNVSVQITNDSREDKTGMNINIYLSTDELITSDDMFLWFSTVDVSSRQTQTADFAFVISGTLLPGSYYIGALVPHIADSDFSNNALSTAFTIPTATELKGVRVDPTGVLPASLATGASATMFHNIKNYGDGISTAFVDRVYLSTDAVLDAVVDREIGFSTIPAGLLSGGGAGATISTIVTIPV